MKAELRELIRDAKDDPDSHCGDFLLLKRIATGAFGEVHKAWDEKGARVVAVKLLTKLNATARQRFAREVKAAKRLEHPHIVAIVSSGEHKRQPFLVMDLVEGESLTELGGKLGPERSVKLVVGIAQAIQFAHDNGVLHRDLKPDNVMVGEGDHAFVLDFGLARFAQTKGPKLTKTGEMVGSPLFMAPEQSAGKFDERSDVYALGAILYFALCGRTPLQADTLDDYLDQLEREHPSPPSSHASGIPADLDTITFNCLEKDPEQRYASAKEVAAELTRFLRGEPIHAKPPSGGTRAWRWLHRNRLGVILGLLAVGAIGATVAAIALR